VALDCALCDISSVVRVALELLHVFTDASHVGYDLT